MKEVGYFGAHYYPFGLNHEGPFYATQPTANQYQYNGKELNEEFGLNWNDYGARFYDPAVGRFTTVDPLANHPSLSSWSPYHYAYDNPIIFIDRDGMSPIRGVVSLGRIGWRAIKMKRRYGKVKGGLKAIAKAEGRSIIRDAKTLLGKGVKFGSRVKALVDLVIGTDLNKAPAGAVSVPVEQITTSMDEGGDDVVDNAGSESSKERAKTKDDAESAQNQVEGIAAAEDAAKKDRPSVADEESEWAGAKKRPKQNKIFSSKKSKQRSRNENNKRDWFGNE